MTTDMEIYRRVRELTRVGVRVCQMGVSERHLPSLWRLIECLPVIDCAALGTSPIESGFTREECLIILSKVGPMTHVAHPPATLTSAASSGRLSKRGDEEFDRWYHSDAGASLFDSLVDSSAKRRADREFDVFMVVNGLIDELQEVLRETAVPDSGSSLYTRAQVLVTCNKALDLAFALTIDMSE